MKHKLLRRISQFVSAILLNSSFKGWTGNPQIYQGKLKKIVAPVLNCYACPSATVSCPAGSAQHFAALKLIPLYVIGSLGAFGVVLGNATCGWVCPFGFLQDIMFKLGRWLKLPKINLPKWFRWGKYLVLVGLVILAPFYSAKPMIDDETGEAMVYENLETGESESLFEPGETWFCKLCPQGALEGGIPQVLLHPELRHLLGWLFTTKMIILGLFLVAFLMIKRPFCRGFCPVGAFLGLFNKISFLQFKVDTNVCTGCNACYRACPVDFKIYEDPNNPTCIRCGDCIKACPMSIIKVGNIFQGAGKESKELWNIGGYS
ncbi:4Fe-4S binding protein [bacterium]|nr:4Fe-4S binding protein [bacterium]